MIRFGIVGCGHIAKRHAKHIINHTEGELIAAFDSDEQALTLFSETFKCETSSNFSELLSSYNINCLVVCTPSGTHSTLVISALKAGLNVLVEKPMSINYEDAVNMVKLSQESKGDLYVVKQNRFNPPVVALKKLMDEGVLGKLYQVNVTCFWNRNERYYNSSNWKGTKALDGGILYNQFSHFIDVLFHLCGGIKEAKGYLSNVKHQSTIEFEDSGAFIFQMNNGAIGSMQVSTCAYEKNHEGSITLLAENGIVKVGGKYLNTVDYSSLKERSLDHLPKSAPANDYGFYQGTMSNHDQVIDNVIQAIYGNEPIMTSAIEGMEVVKMIDQLYSNSEWISSK